MIIKSYYCIEAPDVLHKLKLLNLAINALYSLDGVSFEGTPPNFVEMAEKLENCRKELCDSYFDFDFIAEQIERELKEEEK